MRTAFNLHDTYSPEPYFSGLNSFQARLHGAITNMQKRKTEDEQKRKQGLFNRRMPNMYDNTSSGLFTAYGDDMISPPKL